MNIKIYIKELLATFFFVFMSTLILIMTIDEVSYLAACIGIGLVAMVIHYSFQMAQFNPVLTFACFISKRRTFKTVSIIIACQIIGSFLASALVFALFGDDIGLGLAKTTGNYSYMQAAILEFIFIYMLVLVMQSSTSLKSTRPFSGFIYGAFLTVSYIIILQITGSSLNPAKTIAIAIIAGDLGAISQLLIYAVLPFGASALASGTWILLFKE